MKKKFPRALDPPSAPVTIIDTAMIDRAIEASRKSPRKRIILPFHKSPSDTLHRMVNAIQPLSYVQPHRHLSPPKAESVIVLRGSMCVVTFHDSGDIDSHYILKSNSFEFGLDTDPGIYHTFFALEKDTVVFEVKPGPYDMSIDKDFALWAPKEGDEDAMAYLKGLYDLV